MTVGTQATAAGISAQLTQNALQLRQVCQVIANLQQFMVQLGTSGLENIGYDAGDAQSALNFSSDMNTIAQIYLGTATQATDFDFDNALCPLWAGQ